MSKKNYFEKEELKNLYSDSQIAKKLEVKSEVDISDQIEDYTELVEDYINIGYTREEAKIAAENILASDKK